MPALRSLVLRLETLVTLEHTHSENNAWQEPGGEQSTASETFIPQPAMDAPAREEGQTTEGGTQPEALPAKAEEEGAVPMGGEEQAVHAEEPLAAPASAEPEVQTEPFADFGTSPNGADVVAEEVIAASVDIRQPNLPESNTTDFPLEVAEVLSLEEAVRPFTDFIEEFRQREGHFSALLNEPDTSFTAFVTGPEDLAQIMDGAPFNLGLSEQVEQAATSDESSSAPTSQSEETSPGLNQPRLSSERPVSPLLRPATRPRLPRHSRHRIDELIHPAEMRGGDASKVSTPTPAPVEEPVNTLETPAAAEPKPEEQPARPARRYRFDRPATTASATPLTAKPPTGTPARGTTSREKRGFATRSENGASAEFAPTQVVASNSMASEVPVIKPAIQEPTPPSVETPAPIVAPATERRRRGNHERTRDKEQLAAPVVVPIPEPVAPVVESTPVAAEVPIEDLPPLEYAELQAANSRRRRRRRPGSASTISAVPSSNGAVAPKATLPDLIVPPALPAPVAPSMPTPAPTVPKNVPPTLPAYNIVSGYTVNQMNQGNEVSGPFMGPEPSPARGSTFSSTSIRPVRNDALRNAPVPVKHNESPTLSNASVHHMANVVSQAIQTQTDRMVAELRRANQVPTNVSVTLPPFPSTERVGVFVDVANLLYSARTLRMTVDFGKLLDFLRGNRRLVRAQAYCPTSPQPGDDQMFLQAVKGLGYRITTKNYKTFSSGAKKADLDLDLCMDVVRLVDGGAVDCIVLVSGDSDFMPMLDYCSDHGVRVEVAAFDESMSATLRQGCDLFVNLSMLEEIRA